MLGFLIKVLMTCVSTFITNLKWMSVFQCGLALLLLLIYFYWVSSGARGVVVVWWCSVCLFTP